MQRSGLGMTIGLMGSLWASACAPNTQFRASNSLDASKEVKARSAGMNTDPTDGSGQNQTGRLNVDCFLDSLDAGKLLGEKPLKSLGTPEFINWLHGGGRLVLGRGQHVGQPAD